LSYRDNSILDLVAGRIQQQEQVFLLDEHYRSLPAIIRFSNEQFYRSQLKIMTSTPGSNQMAGVEHIHVDGKRNEKGQNPTEATAIMQAVITLIEKEDHLPLELCQSIGITSPFRAQVEHFKRLVKAVISNEKIRRHRLLIGTAHDFQGEERDIMFNSWIVDRETPRGVYNYLNKEDVFNVSITRARSLQYNYLSVSAEDLPSDTLLHRYVNDNRQRMLQEMNIATSDPFLEDVMSFLEELGVEESFIDYHIAGASIDLVVVHKGETFCIDLVGYPGRFGESLSLDHWKSLSRIGVSSIALAYSHWHFKREGCQAVLAGFLGAYVNEESNEYQLL
jgi:hypothetical protein